MYQIALLESSRMFRNFCSKRSHTIVIWYVSSKSFCFFFGSVAFRLRSSEALAPDWLFHFKLPFLGKLQLQMLEAKSEVITKQL